MARRPVTSHEKVMAVLYQLQSACLDDVAREMALPPITVRRYLEELVDAGWVLRVKVSRRGQPRARVWYNPRPGYEGAEWPTNPS